MRRACTLLCRQVLRSRFPVNDVGRDREDRSRGFGIAIGVVFFDLGQEGLEEPDRDIVRSVVVITVAGEVTLRLEGKTTPRIWRESGTRR